MESVRLPDLETIRRFSIAVRSEHADVEDVIEALRADLQQLLEATGRLRGGTRNAPAAPAPRARPAAPIADDNLDENDDEDEDEAPAPAPRRTVSRPPVRRIAAGAPAARKLPPRTAASKAATGGARGAAAKKKTASRAGSTSRSTAGKRTPAKPAKRAAASRRTGGTRRR